MKLRDGLVALRPEADDSAAVPPSPGGGATSISALLTHRQTLAYFDLRVAGEPETFNHKGEGGKAQALLSVLQAKDAQYVYDEEAVRRAAGAPHSKPLTPQDDGAPSAASANDPCGTEVDEPERSELDRWRTRVGNVDRRLEHARRWLRLRMRTSAGVALLKLEAARDAMQPPLNLIDPDESPLAMVSEMLKLVSSSQYSLLKVADDDRLDNTDRTLVAERVADLRAATERLHEELRRRIGTTRSRLALVYRFKLRCEWHDRDRMVKVAGDPSLGGGPEDRLTAEFARYLFDQGLSPLAKPMTGGLQPDLLDPHARFYVEAKQYEGSARGDIVGAIAQVLDTVGRLRGSQYEVTEAFCIVFRRKGPYYDLPLQLRTETYRLHLVLVDLAAASEAGRRQKEKPVVVTADELLAAQAVLDEKS